MYSEKNFKESNCIDTVMASLQGPKKSTSKEVTPWMQEQRLLIDCSSVLPTGKQTKYGLPLRVFF